jgi:hypothetical protein
VAVDAQTYKPGTVDIEGFVVDLTANKLAASCRFTANSSARVEYSYRKGDDQQQRLQDFAYSSMYTDARQKLQPLLAQVTGGRFVLEK